VRSLRARVRERLRERWRRRGQRWRHRSLFAKVFLHGLLLILLVTGAGMGVTWLFHQGPWREVDVSARYAADQVAALRGDPPALRRELERVREVFGVQASVYDAAGALVASSAAPPLAPLLAPGETEPRGFPGYRGQGRALALRGGGQVVFTMVRRPGFSRRATVALAALLLLIALASVPLARSIAAPISKLTRAARRLGEGDLSTRANVCAFGEVGELATAFDEMAERVEAQVRAEKELLANVSHEVRTPLARIRVALELAAEGDLEKARRYLGEIGADLDELDRLVEDVLSAARLDLAARGGNGRAARLRREPVDLAGVVADAARRFAERWPERALEEDVAGGLPAVSGDAALLRRLLDNLLDNAAKYSEAPAPVRLAARAVDGAALLEVRDQGMGIAAEDLPRLFTPFFRTDRSRARQSGGFGLGLALARRIARAHGGDVEVESEIDKGTVFRVRVPVEGGGPARERGGGA
jgi:two-component system OmpR family sensor kinase